MKTAQEWSQGSLGGIQLAQGERLRIWGELDSSMKVAIVGTRKPTEFAEDTVRQVVQDLVGLGVCIVSGGAIGIDAVAHRAALAAGGKTVVVMPTGLESPYPSCHEGLYQEVLEKGGALLTTAKEGTVARRHQFFRRNAQMVELCAAVILSQFAFKSGTRNTFFHALEQQKRVYVLPAPYGDERFAGSHDALLHASTFPLLRTLEIKDYLKSQAGVMPLESRSPKMSAAEALAQKVEAWARSELSVTQAELYLCVRRGGTTLELAAGRLGLPLQELQVALTTLRLQGCIALDGAGRLVALNPFSGK